MLDPRELHHFFIRARPVISVHIDKVQGSAPRAAGTMMYVSHTQTLGTIGGGALEYQAIKRARLMLTNAVISEHMRLALGPALGQCCGGAVQVSLNRLSNTQESEHIARAEHHWKRRPALYIFGAGHVGRALADVASRAQLRVRVIDSRRYELTQVDQNIEICETAFPEALLRDAEPASAYVIATHDHAVDFLLAGEALMRQDAAYVGMIGSQSKRRQFQSWYQKTYHQNDLSGLTCPIGANARRDKRPAIIAAFVLPELLLVMQTTTHVAEMSHA